jgi:CheY-like chemotaxis protein
MQSHEGVVTVYSQPGKGTTFHLYFPACPAEAPTTVTDSASLPVGQGERILYVDDEGPLAEMGRAVLERLGYHVKACTASTDALVALRAAPDQYDLVITDLTMPGLTGIDLAREVVAIRSSLPLILVTGYSANLTAGQAEAMGVCEILLKPISVHALAHAVRRVLTGSKPN